MLKHRPQQGLSLVELMIAMAISSFLILGTTQIYLDNKRGYLFQQGQAENLENGRFALMSLEQLLSKAGFRRVPYSDVNVVFPAVSVSGCTFAAGQVVTRLSATALCVRYQPRDPQERDCLGNTVSPATAAAIALPYTDTSENFNEQISVDSSGRLLCTRGSASAELMRGIVDVRFEFGVGPSGSRDITRYTSDPSASEVIRSIRYSFLVGSTVGGLSGGMSSKAFSDWYGGARTEPEDGRLYQIVSSTLALRNVMP